MNGAPKKHIVIAGVGFAGLHAYERLDRFLEAGDNVEITLINRGDAFTFIPMIHEVGTGLLQPAAITQPIRLLPKRFFRDFIDGNVVSVDADAQTVFVERSEGFTETIHYDYLILGLGSRADFMGIPGASDNSYPLRTLTDARRLKNRVLECFDKADVVSDDKLQKDLIRFVVVGGGATGVEVAGELSDLISNEMTRAFPRLASRGQVVLVERNERLIKEASETMSKRVKEHLERWTCVDVRTGVGVEQVTENGVALDTGFLDSKTVIWCAGVSAVPTRIEAKKPITRDEKLGRIAVTRFLNTGSYPNLFIVGDQALVMNVQTDRPYGMRAQFATEEGKCAAHNIIASIRGRNLEQFSWTDRGTIISLGKSGALADIDGFHFSGFLARIIYRVAYLYAISGVRAKLRTALEWSLNLFTPRDISKI
ncbi:MAG: NADH dehydrogenase [Candidatus Campbellbacteria bacterium]